jgi:hypothetical protein
MDESCLEKNKNNGLKILNRASPIFYLIKGLEWQPKVASKDVEFISRQPSTHAMKPLKNSVIYDASVTQASVR